MAFGRVFAWSVPLPLMHDTHTHDTTEDLTVIPSPTFHTPLRLVSLQAAWLSSNLIWDFVKLLLCDFGAPLTPV
jgi:hypothetical protein